MRFLAPLVVLVALSGGLAGCVDCQPLLEVRDCRDGQRACTPAVGVEVREWSADDTAAFPGIVAIMDGLAVGEHDHIEYAPGDEDAFWAHWGIDNSAHDQQVFVRHDGTLYRLRVYTCAAGTS